MLSTPRLFCSPANTPSFFVPETYYYAFFPSSEISRRFDPTKNSVAFQKSQGRIDDLS
jgi:hypothetical protein